jgi:8-oxo-dGTP pyrophosphatase MutT (NUDIX family)
MNFVSKNWKTLSKKPLVQNKFMNLWEEEVLRPDGKTSIYYINHRNPFSIIIPYQDGIVYLTKQYRYSVASLSLEFPMGYVEGELPLETAITELKEETGITAGKLTEIGKFWVGPGRSDQWAYVYLARDLVFGSQKLEDGEFITIEKYPLEKISEMIKSAEILDGPSIAAYHYLEEYVKNNSL